MELQPRQDTLDTIRAFRLPRYQEIPDVGFYLQQTAKYINTYMQPFCDMDITESMISNYVKKHLVGNPARKQYSREQTAYLLFITVAKSVLPLDHIQLLIDIQKQTYSAPVAYDYFCSEFENILQFVFGLKSEVEPVGEDTTEAKFLLQKIIIAAAHKIYLNHCFTMLKTERAAHPKQS